MAPSGSAPSTTPASPSGGPSLELPLVHEAENAPIATEEVGAEVGVGLEAARAGPRFEDAVAEQAGADAVGVDRVAADAVRAEIDCVLPHERDRGGLGDRVGAEARAGVERRLRGVE